MKNQEQIVKEEMRKLISNSCTRTQSPEQNPYYSFQKTLLKYFFNAADVNIDYAAGTITLWTSEAPSTLGHNLYRLKDAIPVTISYTDLEETLKGCLENGENENRFYRSLLFQYNNLTEPFLSNAISA
jgi:hypothetical protein